MSDKSESLWGMPPGMMALAAISLSISLPAPTLARERDSARERETARAKAMASVVLHTWRRSKPPPEGMTSVIQKCFCMAVLSSLGAYRRLMPRALQ